MWEMLGKTSDLEGFLARLQEMKMNVRFGTWNLAELFQAAGEKLLSEIQELINSIWNKEELPKNL
jgi:hypothetical protein